MPAAEKQCGFCGKVGPHPEAHIFPKALYRSEKGVANRLYKLSGEVPPKKSQNGIYDADLWCQACEAEAAKLENRVTPILLDIEKHKQPFKDQHGLTVTVKGEVQVWTLQNIDPADLTQFVLSVLWRCSASQRDELKKFSLGPYQERIRQVLQSKKVEDLSAYPFTLRYEKEPELRGGFITPANTKYDEVRFTRFSGGGLAYDIKMSGFPLPECFRNLACRPNGVIYLLSYTLPETKEGRGIMASIRKQSA